METLFKLIQQHGPGVAVLACVLLLLYIIIKSLVEKSIAANFDRESQKIIHEMGINLEKIKQEINKSNISYQLYTSELVQRKFVVAEAYFNSIDELYQHCAVKLYKNKLVGSSEEIESKLKDYILLSKNVVSNLNRCFIYYPRDFTQRNESIYKSLRQIHDDLVEVLVCSRHSDTIADRKSEKYIEAEKRTFKAADKLKFSIDDFKENYEMIADFIRDSLEPSKILEGPLTPPRTT